MSDKQKSLLALVVFVPFTAFSFWVIAGQGVVGLIDVVGREPWALQLLIDLVIGCSMVLGYAWADARQRGIIFWPFALGTLFLGTISLLAYYVARPWLGKSPAVHPARV
ncbi:MAG: hypothetical protein AAF658_04805 [Myxococcota bacterium]